MQLQAEQKKLLFFVIIVVNKEAVPNNLLERSEVSRIVIIPIPKELLISNNIRIRYGVNVAVLIDHRGNPTKTRDFGAITKELRELNFTKIN